VFTKLIERLESRRLMSATISTSADGSILITNAANVSVTEFDVGNTMRVGITDNTLPDGSNSAVLFGNFSSVMIVGTTGNDQIMLNTFDLNAVIDGGNGDDFIQAFIGSTQTQAGTAQVAISAGNGGDFISVDGSIPSPSTVQEQGTFFVDGGNGQDTIQIIDPIQVVVLPSRGGDVVVGTPA